MKLFVVVFFISTLQVVTYAQKVDLKTKIQDPQLTENDVQTESIFIQAITNKLIDRHDLSIPQYREILKKEPDNHVVWYELGFGLFKTKQFAEALDAVNKSLTYQPNKSNYLLLLADIQHALQDYKQEIAVLKKIQPLMMYEESVYTRWVDLLIQNGSLQEAINVLDMLENKKGINEISSLRKATLFEQLGKSKDAELELVVLNETFPGELKYMHALASFYLKSKKEDKALDVYRSILSIQPGDEKANLSLAKSFKTLGQDDQYLESIKSLMENPSIALDAKILELIPYLNKAIQSSNESLLATIEKYGLQLVGLHPKEPKLFALLGDVYNSKKQRGKAGDYYKTAIKLGKTPKSVWINYLEIAELLEDPAEWLKHAETAFDLYPNDGMIASMYVHACLTNDQISTAKSTLLQSQLMGTGNKNLQLRNSVLQMIVDHEEGRSETLKASWPQLAATSSNGAFLLLHFLIHKNAGDKVLELIHTAPKSFQELPEVLAFQAMAYSKKKSFTEAKPLLLSALQNNSVLQSILQDNLGDVLFHLKDVDAALVAWKSAAELNPLNHKVKKKIQDKTIE